LVFEFAQHWYSNSFGISIRIRKALVFDYSDSIGIRIRSALVFKFVQCIEGKGKGREGQCEYVNVILVGISEIL
jgi:hypothetical protein